MMWLPDSVKIVVCPARSSVRMTMSAPRSVVLVIGLGSSLRCSCSLSALGGGEGQGEVGATTTTATIRAVQGHQSPTSPCPLRPQGRRGNSADPLHCCLEPRDICLRGCETFPVLSHHLLRGAPHEVGVVQLLRD